MGHNNRLVKIIECPPRREAGVNICQKCLRKICVCVNCFYNCFLLINFFLHKIQVLTKYSFSPEGGPGAVLGAARGGGEGLQFPRHLRPGGDQAGQGKIV